MALTFVDEIFPEEIGKKSIRSIVHRTSVTELDSGADERAARWAGNRRRWNVKRGIDTLANLQEVNDFMEAVGMVNAWRFRDPLDYSSDGTNHINPTPTQTDQRIGIGNAVKTQFQLIKVYTFGQRTKTRTITKPRSGSLLVAVAGALKTEGVDYAADHSTGLIDFTLGSAPLGAPGNGQTVDAGYLYDNVAAFHPSMDEGFRLSLDEFEAGRMPDVIIEEDLGQPSVPDYPPLGSTSTVASMTGSVLYDYSMGRTVAFQPTVASLSVTLPAISELPLGGPLFTFANIGTQSLAFKYRNTGATAFTVASTKSAFVHILSIGGARAWLALGSA